MLEALVHKQPTGSCTKSSVTLCTSAVELLQAMLGQLQSDQILGWFAYRPVTLLQPTSQECMITSSMLAALHSLDVTMQSYQPLFAVLSSLPRHDDCSVEIQQRLFSLNPHR